MYFEVSDEEDIKDSEEFINTKCKEIGNVTTDHIRIQLVLPLQDVRKTSLHRLFDCIRRKLPNSGSELYITATNTICIEELTFILEKIPDLKLLEMENIKLQGSNVSGLCNSLRKQAQLRTIYLQDMEHVHDEVNLQPLANALASLPHLESLELCRVSFAKHSMMNAHALASLARSLSLKSLEIMPCPCHDTDWQGLAVITGLHRNPHLTKLGLLASPTRPKTTMFQYPVLASVCSLLQSNLTNLETLDLHVSGDINMLPLTVALKSNRTLKNLSLCWDSYHAPLRIFANALRDVVKYDNFVMTHIDIALMDENNNKFGKELIDEELEFYLQLNRKGRRHILGQNHNQAVVPQKKWIQVLGDCQDYLRGSFYFLSLNPLLCYPSTASALTTAGKRQRDFTATSSGRAPPRKRSCTAFEELPIVR